MAVGHSGVRRAFGPASRRPRKVPIERVVVRPAPRPCALPLTPRVRTRPSHRLLSPPETLARQAACRGMALVQIHSGPKRARRPAYSVVRRLKKYAASGAATARMTTRPDQGRLDRMLHRPRMERPGRVGVVPEHPGPGGHRADGVPVGDGLEPARHVLRRHHRVRDERQREQHDEAERRGRFGALRVHADAGRDPRQRVGEEAAPGRSRPRSRCKLDPGRQPTARPGEPDDQGAEARGQQVSHGAADQDGGAPHRAAHGSGRSCPRAGRCSARPRCPSSTSRGSATTGPPTGSRRSSRHRGSEWRPPKM